MNSHRKGTIERANGSGAPAFERGSRRGEEGGEVRDSPIPSVLSRDGAGRAALLDVARAQRGVRFLNITEGDLIAEDGRTGALSAYSVNGCRSAARTLLEICALIFKINAFPTMTKRSRRAR